MELKNQVAIVTGASQGIGKGISTKLAQHGAKVYLVARTLSTLEKTRDEIKAKGGNVEVRPGDITDLESMGRIIDEVYATENRLDIFVNNAGEWVMQTVGTPWSEIKRQIEFNMLAPLAITDYLINKFRELKENHLRVLSVSSQAAVRVFDNGIGYGAAKIGLTGGLFNYQEALQSAQVKHITLYQLFPNTVATEKMIPGIKANEVQDPVRLDEVVDTALSLLEGKTPTRNSRIGYYPGRGIVRSNLPDNPEEFYKTSGTTDDVIDQEFKPENLFR